MLGKERVRPHSCHIFNPLGRLFRLFGMERLPEAAKDEGKRSADRPFAVVRKIVHEIFFGFNFPSGRWLSVLDDPFARNGHAEFFEYRRQGHGINERQPLVAVISQEFGPFQKLYLKRRSIAVLPMPASGNLRDPRKVGNVVEDESGGYGNPVSEVVSVFQIPFGLGRKVLSFRREDVEVESVPRFDNKIEHAADVPDGDFHGTFGFSRVPF